jgi:hypothetical protein
MLFSTPGSALLFALVAGIVARRTAHVRQVSDLMMFAHCDEISRQFRSPMFCTRMDTTTSGQ